MILFIQNLKIQMNLFCIERKYQQQKNIIQNELIWRVQVTAILWFFLSNRVTLILVFKDQLWIRGHLLNKNLADI